MDHSSRYKSKRVEAKVIKCDIGLHDDLKAVWFEFDVGSKRSEAKFAWKCVGVRRASIFP